MLNPPNTKDFSAWINLMPGSSPKLIVVGKVETTATNKHPKLNRAEPQGINTAELILELTIEEDGVGAQVVSYQEVRYEAPASRGQYSHVLIRWEGSPLEHLVVTEAH